MAIWRSTLAKAALDVAAVREAQGVDFETARDEAFAYLEEKAQADDAQYEGEQAEKPARSSSSSRSSKTSSRKGGGRKGGSSISLDDALGMEMNSGAFEGATLGEIVELSAEQADADYNYGDGERDGKDYIAWLSSERNPNDFTRRRAVVVAAEYDIEPLAS